jgi:hypothetical protein
MRPTAKEWLSHDTFFLTGSHGCGRNSGSYRTSTFLDVKMDLSGAEDSIETSIRLNPALAAMFGSDYGADIEAGKGVSIEGLAAGKTTLYFGLRSPVTADGTAFIVAAGADNLFSSSPASATSIDVPFGENVGIRDLAILDEAGPVLLILSGPVAGEGSSAAIWAFDVATGKLDKLADIAPAAGGKPEGLLLAEQSHGELRVLVLHDSLIDGEPTEFTLPYP